MSGLSPHIPPSSRPAESLVEQAPQLEPTGMQMPVTPKAMPPSEKVLSFSSQLAHERMITPSEVQSAFPETYFASRERFLQSAEKIHARIFTREIIPRGPDNERLHIDIAHIGAEAPRKLILHLAGVHGVEGFVGSAVQYELLRATPVLAEDTALVLVHCLNPYGMAHLRRVTADNVDLNRNLMPAGEKWRGATSIYNLLSPLLNPSSIGFSWSLYPQLWLKALVHGKENVKDALLHGQYNEPRGLFFGGTQHEEELVILKDYLTKRFSAAERVVGIDVHSGLGEFGKQTLFLEIPARRARFGLLEKTMGITLTPEPDDYHDPRKHPRGALCDELPKFFPKAHVDWFLQEFGTYNPYRVLAALRAENCYAHIGHVASRWEAAQKLKEMFAPADIRWRTAVLRMGTQAVAQAQLALLV
ncbi:MAG: DUF2817 domain-containing protein [Deltaproteobacteria bacterium]|nr:DUF2817 domain-containing protein [Deltaproteobacteria bacterium]